MKKLLTTILLTLLFIPSSASARRSEFMYVTTSAGYLRLYDVGGAKSINNKYFDLGVGTYMQDDLRVEMVYEHYLDPRNRREDKDANGPVLEVYRHKMDNLLLSVYADFLDFEFFTLFAGGGVGISQLTSEIDVRKVATDGSGIVLKGASKKKYNFIYALHAGFFIQIADEMYLYPKYSYRGFGKTRNYSEGGAPVTDAKSLSGHTLSVGIRIDV